MVWFMVSFRGCFLFFGEGWGWEVIGVGFGGSVGG
jgi:hypothetical protein